MQRGVRAVAAVRMHIRSRYCVSAHAAQDSRQLDPSASLEDRARQDCRPGQSGGNRAFFLRPEPALRHRGAAHGRDHGSLRRDLDHRDTAEIAAGSVVASGRTVGRGQSTDRRRQSAADRARERRRAAQAFRRRGRPADLNEPV